MKVSVYIKKELTGRVQTHQLQRLGIKESFENTDIQRFLRSFEAINGTSGRIMVRNESQCLYETDKAETCSFKCHNTQYFINFSFNYDFFTRLGPLIWPRTS
jgi:hypothetical protein